MFLYVISEFDSAYAVYQEVYDNAVVFKLDPLIILHFAYFNKTE